MATRRQHRAVPSVRSKFSQTLTDLACRERERVDGWAVSPAGPSSALVVPAPLFFDHIVAVDLGHVALTGRPELRRELGRLDTVCFMVAAVVVLDTLGAVALGGVETFTWLAIVSLGFLIPAGLVVAELGSAFPHAGGPYVWARKAFGRTAGSLVALAYWVEAAVWIGGSLAITAIAVVNELVVPVTGPWRGLMAVGFIWTAVLFAAIPLRAGKRIANIGAFTQVTLLGFFTATVGFYAMRQGVADVTVGAAAPSWAGFALVAPILVYSFLGLELPSAAGQEMHNPQRDIPASIAKAGAIITVLYAVPILAILLVVPSSERSGLTGFIDALASVFTVYGDAAGLVKGVVGLAFVFVLLANGLTWLIGSSRAAAAACFDGAGPAWFAQTNESTGTPIRAVCAAGFLGTVTMATAFAVAGNDNAKYFSAVLTLSIALLAVGNLLVFPALIRLRSSCPDTVRPFRVPGGSTGAWFVSGLATAWVLLAIVAVLWPGLGTNHPDAHLPEGFAGDRLGFTLIQLIPLAGVVAVAVVFAHLGARRERPAGEMVGGR